MPESSVRPRRIVVGVSGASGAALGLECLKCLRQAGAESALVVTRGGEITIEQELGMTLDKFAAHVDVVYDNKNIGAAIASGTYPVDGMIVAPCSMKTLAGIASGYSENLLLRGRRADERAAPPGAHGARDALQRHSHRQHGAPGARAGRHAHAAHAHVLQRPRHAR